MSERHIFLRHIPQADGWRVKIEVRYHDGNFGGQRGYYLAYQAEREEVQSSMTYIISPCGGDAGIRLFLAPATRFSAKTLAEHAAKAEQHEHAAKILARVEAYIAGQVTP